MSIRLAPTLADDLARSDAYATNFLREVDQYVTRRGASAIPGLYFMGLNWMNKRKSGIIYGVGEDARDVARQIAGH